MPIDDALWEQERDREARAPNQSSGISLQMGQFVGREYLFGGAGGAGVQLKTIADHRKREEDTLGRRAEQRQPQRQPLINISICEIRTLPSPVQMLMMIMLYAMKMRNARELMSARSTVDQWQI